MRAPTLLLSLAAAVVLLTGCSTPLPDVSRPWEDQPPATAQPEPLPGITLLAPESHDQEPETTGRSLCLRIPGVEILQEWLGTATELELEFRRDPFETFTCLFYGPSATVEIQLTEDEACDWQGRNCVPACVWTRQIPRGVPAAAYGYDEYGGRTADGTQNDRPGDDGIDLPTSYATCMAEDLAAAIRLWGPRDDLWAMPPAEPTWQELRGLLWSMLADAELVEDVLAIPMPQ